MLQVDVLFDVTDKLIIEWRKHSVLGSSDLYESFPELYNKNSPCTFGEFVKYVNEKFNNKDDRHARISVLSCHAADMMRDSGIL